MTYLLPLTTATSLRQVCHALEASSFPMESGCLFLWGLALVAALAAPVALGGDQVRGVKCERKTVRLHLHARSAGGYKDHSKKIKRLSVHASQAIALTPLPGLQICMEAR